MASASAAAAAAAEDTTIEVWPSSFGRRSTNGSLYQFFEERFRHVGEQILSYCSWKTVAALRKAAGLPGVFDNQPEFIFNKSVWWYERFVRDLQKRPNSHEMWLLVVEAITASNNYFLDHELITVFCKELDLLNPPNVKDILLLSDRHAQLQYECHVYLHLIDWPLQCILRHMPNGHPIVNYLAKNLLWSDMLLLFRFYAYESPLHRDNLCMKNQQGGGVEKKGKKGFCLLFIALFSRTKEQQQQKKKVTIVFSCLGDFTKINGKIKG